MELGDDDPFSSVDDKSPFVGHHGNSSHVDFFFFNPCLIRKTKLDFQSDIIGDSAADAFFRSIFGNT